MPRIALLLIALVLAAGCGPSKPAAPDPTPASPQPAPPDATPIPARETPPAVAPAAAGTIRGAVTHPGKKGQGIRVGYIELLAEKEVGDLIPYDTPGPDEVAQVSSNVAAPRKSVLSFDKGATAFEFTGLPAGTYFVFAQLDGGPATWAKVDVKDGAAVTRDFKLEAGKGGTVEVTTPADFTGEVRLSPDELVPAGDDTFAAGRMATQMNLGGKAMGGKVTISEVPPGRYTLFAIPGVLAPRGMVQVTAGITATVELAKEKK